MLIYTPSWNDTRPKATPCNATLCPQTHLNSNIKSLSSRSRTPYKIALVGKNHPLPHAPPRRAPPPRILLYGKVKFYTVSVECH